MKIVMLLDNPYTNDGRVEREAESLVAAGHTLVLFCVMNLSLPAREIRNGVEIRRIFDSHLHDFWKIKLLFIHKTEILAERPDVLHCHDQLMLHLGASLKKSFPSCILVYDSHELFHSWPLNVSSYSNKIIFLKSWIVRRYQIAREKMNARQIDYLITVNDSIANILAKYFRLKNPALTLRNIPVKTEFFADPNFLRSKFNISSATKILVFIGSAIYPKTLNLEMVIDDVGDKPDIAFIIIAGDQGGKKDIINYVKHKGYQNIYFHQKIPFAEISNYLAACDVGLVPTYNKSDLSYWLALDNKLFEYILAGLPVLAGAQPEIAAVVEKYNVGVCLIPDHKNAYLVGLNKILGNMAYYKENSSKASVSLNWQQESKGLLEFYKAMNSK